MAEPGDRNRNQDLPGIRDEDIIGRVSEEDDEEFEDSEDVDEEEELDESDR
jgi:hypothetical protein